MVREAALDLHSSSTTPFPPNTEEEITGSMEARGQALLTTTAQEQSSALWVEGSNKQQKQSGA